MRFLSTRTRRRLPQQYRLLAALALLHFIIFAGPLPPAAAAGHSDSTAAHSDARANTTTRPSHVAASLPFDLKHMPPTKGLGVLVLVLLLAVSTLVSEDLTCIWAGVLAAEGRISFALATMACLLGIFLGDILLFLAGRYLGRPALERAPLKWLIKSQAVESSSAWFNRRGSAVIVLSRFLPGTRLPTYFAAGLLDTSFWRFSLFFFVAAALWTPALVGLSMLLGAEAIESSLMLGRRGLIKPLISAVLIFVMVKLVLRLVSFRGRRLLFARWRRIARWEFWPPWVLYVPVVCYLAYLALKHRSLTLFTCANPAIPGGGFIGESKIEILRQLSRQPSSQPLIARAAIIDASLSFMARVDAAREFVEQAQLSFPVVLKPDVGQRGAGVSIVQDEAQLSEYLRAAAGDTIIQEYVPGFEFGVFYVRRPKSEKGWIFAVTDKRFPSVVGDGDHTLEQLILQDDRAVLMAQTHFEKHGTHLLEVPAAGEAVQLVELGTHCRGSLFLDGSWVVTRELEAAVDKLGRSFEGFYFGRFDIRTPSIEDFQKGENFKVVELNGVTSEATSIYDPRNGLLTAYRILFEQWRIAFEIGGANCAQGVSPMTVSDLARLVLDGFKHPGRRSTTNAKTKARASSSVNAGIVCDAQWIQEVEEVITK
jgi:membrane protein DedA with SNARE-associated domain